MCRVKNIEKKKQKMDEIKKSSIKQDFPDPESPYSDLGSEAHHQSLQPETIRIQKFPLPGTG